jgi:hypothetical protein
MEAFVQDDGDLYTESRRKELQGLVDKGVF